MRCGVRDGFPSAQPSPAIEACRAGRRTAHHAFGDMTPEGNLQARTAAEGYGKHVHSSGEGRRGRRVCIWIKATPLAPAARLVQITAYLVTRCMTRRAMTSPCAHRRLETSAPPVRQIAVIVIVAPAALRDRARSCQRRRPRRRRPSPPRPPSPPSPPSLEVLEVDVLTLLLRFRACPRQARGPGGRRAPGVTLAPTTTAGASPRWTGTGTGSCAPPPVGEAPTSRRPAPQARRQARTAPRCC